MLTPAEGSAAGRPPTFSAAYPSTRPMMTTAATPAIVKIIRVRPRNRGRTSASSSSSSSRRRRSAVLGRIVVLRSSRTRGRMVVERRGPRSRLLPPGAPPARLPRLVELDPECFDPPRPDPDVPEPDVPEPDVPEPDVPDPDVPDPDVPEPDVPEPDVPDPDVPDPDVPEEPEPMLPLEPLRPVRGSSSAEPLA